MKTHKKLLPILLLTACGGGGGGSPVETPVTPSNPVEGTVLDSSCNGYTLVETIADGNGGSTQQETEYSADCGAPQEGDIIGEPFCIHTDSELIETYKPFNDMRSYYDSVKKVSDGKGGFTVEKNIHIDEACFIEMEKPDDCPTAFSYTNDSRYDYLTCDGVKQRTEVSYPYTPGYRGLAIIDILAVVDTKITEEERGNKSVRDFILYQLHYANMLFYRSGVDIALRLAGIKEVEVAKGDLYRQYNAFFNGRYEFVGLDNWQKDANADIAFLFKQIEEEPIACGVANVDGTRGLRYTRGITQCFTNTTFQYTETTRYYKRAAETFTHEIGHILGLEHHWEVLPNGTNTAGTGLFEYSYGYNLVEYNPQENNPDYTGSWGGYGTIMSYADLQTARFSDPSVICLYPDEAGDKAGTAARLGTEGGCFCIDPIEDQPPPTNATEHLQRVRWVMSQLDELGHAVFSPAEVSDTQLQLDINREILNRSGGSGICVF